ncbi:hypothetical protein ACFV8T_08840 [Streptomyces sp. NPDC059832]|uniref:hypothetical protein n=1 Tax=unclassified Streptomyces TaxID=2593676 RepID=UPI0036479412
MPSSPPPPAATPLAPAFGTLPAARFAQGAGAARAVTTAGLGTGAAGLAFLAATGLDARTPYAYGLLPGLVLLPVGAAASFGGAAVLATEGVPQQQTGLAGGVLNSAMGLGPTVLFAVLLRARQRLLVPGRDRGSPGRCRLPEPPHRVIHRSKELPK